MNITEPLTKDQIIEQLVETGEDYLTTYVGITISELIVNDFEAILDMLSERATGSTLLMDINYTPVDFDTINGTVMFKVTGDPSEVLAYMED